MTVVPAHPDTDRASVPSTGEGPILLPFDDSVHAHAAMHWASRLFGPWRKAIVLVVLEVPRSIPQPRLHAVEAQAWTVAMNGLAEARQAGFTDVDTRVVRERRRVGPNRGAISRRILDEATRCAAGVIAVGSRGRTGLGAAVLGSVSAGLLSHSHVPLLVVPPEANPDLCDGPALLCWDGTDGKILDVAAHLLTRRRRRDAIVSYVWSGATSPVSHLLAPWHWFSSTKIAEEAAQERASRVASEGEQAARTSGFANAHGVTAESTVDLAQWLPHAGHLDVVERVASIADAHRASVVVVSPHGDGVANALRRVSVTRGLMHHDSFIGHLVETRHPVLVVPRTRANPPDADGSVTPGERSAKRRRRRALAA